MKKFKVKYTKTVIEVEANSFQTLLSNIIAALNLAPSTTKITKPLLKSQADFQKLKGGEELAVVGPQLKQVEKLIEQKARPPAEPEVKKEEKKDEKKKKVVDPDDSKSSEEDDESSVEEVDTPIIGTPIKESNDDDDDDLFPDNSDELLQQDYNLDELYIGEDPIQGQKDIIDDIDLEALLEQRIQKGPPANLPPPKKPVPRKRPPKIILGYIDDSNYPVSAHSALYAAIHLLINTPKLFQYVKSRAADMVRPALQQAPAPQPVQHFILQFHHFYSKLMHFKRTLPVPFFVLAELWLQYRSWFRQSPIYTPSDLLTDIPYLLGRDHLTNRLQPQIRNLLSIDLQTQYTSQGGRVPKTTTRHLNIWQLPIVLSKQTEQIDSLGLLVDRKFIEFPEDPDDDVLEEVKKTWTGGRIREMLFEVNRLPEYLLVKVDRYGKGGQKNRQFVKISKFLDLNGICSKELQEIAEDARERRYQAMTNKYGETSKKEQKQLSELENCYSKFDEVASDREYDAAYNSVEAENSCFTNSYKLVGFTTSTGTERCSQTYAAVFQIRRNLWYYRRGTDQIITMTEKQALRKFDGSEPSSELADLFLFKRIYFGEICVLGDSPSSSFFQSKIH